MAENIDIKQLIDGDEVFYPQTDINALVNNGEYAIDEIPTIDSSNLVTSGGVASELALGAVYDVTAHNGSAQFASLQALLTDPNLNTLIPTNIRRGGMSIKFVSDNKYVQYRLMAQTFSTTESDWQGVDDEPTAESDNLVKSGGVKSYVDVNNMFTDNFGELLLSFRVSINTALRKTFNLSKLSISNKKIRLFLNTPLIDYNGVCVSINGETAIYLYNNAYIEATVEGALSTISISRAASGIIGTGDVEVQCYVYSNKLEKTEEVANLDYFFNKGAYTFSFYTPRAGLLLNETVDLSVLNIKAGATLSLNMQVNGNIDTNGVNISLGGVNTVLKPNIERSVTLVNDLTTAVITRSGNGIVASGRVDISLATTTDLEKVETDVTGLQASVENISEGLIEGTILLDEFSPTMIAGYYYDASGTLVENGDSKYTEAIDISQYAGKNIKIVVTCENVNPSSSRASLVTDKNDTVLKVGYEGEIAYYGNIDFGVLPADAKYLKLSFRKTAKNIKVSVTKILEQKDYRSVVYVDAENGSDDNSGTKTSPLASISKALSITDADTEIVLLSDVTESVNLKQKEEQRSVTIIGEKGKRNKFILGTKITEAIQYSGNVYYAELESFPSANKVPVFQHEIADASTLITDEERHPLQRGREYRCESTLLLSAESIQAVVDAETQMYYWDSTASRLYFKIADGSNLSNNPIVIPNWQRAVYGNDGSVKLTMTNVDVWYGYFDLSLCHSAIISNCSAKYTLSAGGFVWDNAIGMKLIQCEAARVYSGTTTGDGFNAHSTESSDAQSRHTTCTMIDCWSHDNNDDGYSDHERCECSIHGGLFEYNGKAGVTPATGSHLVCYNVLSRRNHNGFYYTIEVPASEGGKYGQMTCYNCVAENNSSEFGFGVQGSGNSMVLVSCKSIGNPKGYIAKANTKAVLIDCGSLNNTIVKEQASGATITIQNTMLVE